MITGSCQSCKAPLTFSGVVGFREECRCGADIHCCLNCQFHDPKVYNECTETQADRILEKEKANYCEFFALSSGSKASGANDKDKLKAAAEALFKKK